MRSIAGRPVHSVLALANPVVGSSASQEFLRGHAEDHFVVLLTNAEAKVPVGSFKNVLVTVEWTPWSRTS